MARLHMQSFFLLSDLCLYCAIFMRGAHGQDYTQAHVCKELYSSWEQASDYFSPALEGKEWQSLGSSLKSELKDISKDVSQLKPAQNHSPYTCFSVCSQKLCGVHHFHDHPSRLRQQSLNV